MKWFLTLFLAFVALILPSFANATAIGGEEFTKVIFLQSAAESPSPSANNDGRDYASAKPLVDGNLWAVPKNVVISNVFIVIDEAVAGLTAFNIGDTDTSNGFIASTGPSASLAATGLMYWDVAYKGSYLRESSVVSNHSAAKFYSATGKYLTIDVTGTASRGQMRVFVKGYGIGATP